jgi:hypothetical protein
VSRFVVMQERWSPQDIAPEWSAPVCYTRWHWFARVAAYLACVFGADGTYVYIKDISQ